MTKLVKCYKIINVIFSNYSVLMAAIFINITREKLYNNNIIWRVLQCRDLHYQEIYITERVRLRHKRALRERRLLSVWAEAQ